MIYLIVNIGSSSIKLDLVNNTEEILESYFEYHKNQVSKCLEKMLSKIKSFDAIIHRVVHSGHQIQLAEKVTEQTISKIQNACPLAPLHNPNNLIGINTCQKVFNKNQFVVYDTGFFKDIPDFAHIIAIPKQLREKYHIRKYGFHGIAHANLVEQAITQASLDKQKHNIISVQLGNGCSVALVQNGKAVDTSMDFTPLAGLIMGTRVGDLDPGIFNYIQQNDANLNLNDILNKESGLLGLSNKYSSMQDIIANKDSNPEIQTTYNAFCYRVAKYISAYAGLCNNINAIVFGGGISFNAPQVTYDIMNRVKGFVLATHLVCETQESIQMVKTINNLTS